MSDHPPGIIDYRSAACEKPSNQNELADLSDLLAQYDSVKRQQEKVNFRRQQKGRQRSSQHHLETISNVAAAVFDDEPHAGDANGRADADHGKHHLRKPQLCPMMPVFTAAANEGIDHLSDETSFDKFKTDWMTDKQSQSFGMKIANGPKMADSGIEVINPQTATLSMGSSSITSVSTVNNTSDGYSSDSSFSSAERDLTTFKPISRTPANKSPVKV